MQTPVTTARNGLSAALFALSLLGPSVVGAQPQDRSAAAQTSFRQGLAEMDAHRYASALTALEESYRLYPSPVALYNLALAHRELGHTQRAIEHFERYLAEGGSHVAPERVTTVREAIHTLHDQLVTLTLNVTPTTFTTMVDGRELPTARGVLVLDPGDHVLVVTAAGYRSFREELHLAAGRPVTRGVTLAAENAPTPAVTPAVVATPTVAPTPPLVVSTGPTPHPRDENPSPAITSRWWFWTGLGAVVVAGAVTGIVLATSGSSEPLVSGTAFDVQTIRSR